MKHYDTTFWWRFNTIPDPKEIEKFIDQQIPLFSRNVNFLTGADGQPIVDTFKVEHNNGVTNLEFQLNGTPGAMGDIFAFPGYFPGDLDDQGKPLYNVCNTYGHFYGKIVGIILGRARYAIDMEWTTSEKKAKLYQAK